jgi:hypothetical protein
MRSSRTGAGAAALLGALALITLPAAVAATRFSDRLELLRTLYVAVPVAVVLALAGLGAERRARYRRARRVSPGGTALPRAARLLVFLAVYVSITAALALGVYGLLRWAQH